MARDRNKNREKVREQRLELKNSFNNDDPTPRDAVDRIRRGGGYGRNQKGTDSKRFMP